MGLQAMGRNWDPENIVSDVCIAVRNLWNTPGPKDEWDMGGVASAMYDLLGLHTMAEDRLYSDHVTKVSKLERVKLSIGRAIGFGCARKVYRFL